MPEAFLVSQSCFFQPAEKFQSCCFTGISLVSQNYYKPLITYNAQARACTYTCAVAETPNKRQSHLPPVRLDLDCLTGVLESIFIVAFLSVGSRAVTIQDVVWRIEGHSFCVAAHRLINISSTQCFVALVLQHWNLPTEKERQVLEFFKMHINLQKEHTKASWKLSMAADPYRA